MLRMSHCLTSGLAEYLDRLNLPADTFRPLCSGNNSLGAPNAFITEDCLMSRFINSEVLARRNDPHLVSLKSLLSHLDNYFGAIVQWENTFIDLHAYSPFDGTNDLLFKDSVKGFSSSFFSELRLAKNYFQLFEHLDSCTGSSNSLTVNGVFSLLSLMFFGLLSI
ncbi:hypothetical protein EVAR_53649_1 [Eumeta japonica]|uniref:Uncharacterized protein n=1 Tax=Eumeta variegata TaxID=151549 RepID=A0A4C1YNA4_EUMVA|nr:hypothetical protein EVAR_53649_1 [Eumeta japonica]